MLVFSHINLSAIVFGSKRPSSECLIPFMASLTITL